MNEKINTNTINSLFQIRKLFLEMVKAANESSTKKVTINLLNKETVIGNLVNFGFDNSKNLYTIAIITETIEKTIDFKNVESTTWEK